MAIYGQEDCTASTNNSIISGGLSFNAAININLCNRSGAAVVVSLYIVLASDATPANKHLWESVSIDAGCTLERTGIPLSTGDLIFVNPAASGISCTVVGLPT